LLYLEAKYHWLPRMQTLIFGPPIEIPPSS
jgi:hypothetical protein